MGWSKMVDMKRDDDDIIDMACPIPIEVGARDEYPYGLRICLTHEELEKLGLEATCDMGDVIDLRAFAVVTSISMNETDRGKECRVELQIQKLAIENEAKEMMPGENEGAERRKSPLHDRS